MMANKKEKRINEALSVLIDLGLPRPQQNDRSALCLLALLNLTPNKMWSEVESKLIGITPIMDWVSTHYGRQYAPNSRETFRRFTMHQFVQAGLALYNPDSPDRPVNSPKAVYQIEPTCLKVIRTFGTKNYRKNLQALLVQLETLSARYAKHREMEMVPIKIAGMNDIQISPGSHSELLRAIWENFGPRFVPGGLLIYAGDTGDKWGYFDEKLLLSLGVKVDNHGKMPDVIIYYPKRNWLIIAEAVTSHGRVMTESCVLA